MGKIAVIGTGYVGLTTGACFAQLGHDVICADIDADEGRAAEPGGDPHPRARPRPGRRGRSGCRVVWPSSWARPPPHGTASSPTCACPRPRAPTAPPTSPTSRPPHGRSVLSCPPNAVVINKSTVPVGSTRVVERALGRSDVSVVSNPEFLREGNAVTDFLQPDRVVIGADDQSAAVRVASLYVGVPAPLMVTDPASAETIKYACNAFLATKLSFVNAVSAICEAVGADVNDVILGMGYDKRIGHEFLRPGPGWGGSCFPKDTKALIHIADDYGYDFKLLRGVVEVNEEQFARTAEKVVKAAGGSVAGVRIAAWGLDVQGPHRRPARVARPRDTGPPRRSGRPAACLRPGHPQPPPAARGGPRHRGGRRSVRRGRRRGGAGRADRVGRVQVAGHGQGA